METGNNKQKAQNKYKNLEIKNTYRHYYNLALTKNRILTIKVMIMEDNATSN